MTHSSHKVALAGARGGPQEAHVSAVIVDAVGARALARDLASAFTRMWPGADEAVSALPDILNARGAARAAADFAAGGAVDRLIDALDADGEAFLFALAERLAEKKGFSDD